MYSTIGRWSDLEVLLIIYTSEFISFDVKKKSI